METPQPIDYASHATDSGAAPRRRGWTGLMVLVGPIVTYLTMLAAHGNGWSPLLFILLGLIATPLLAGVLVRRLTARPWTARLLAMVGVGLLSFVLSIYSTRIDATDTFTRTFNTAPPPGMTLIEGRTQWYDGPNYFISFQANQAAMNSMLALAAYTDESASGALGITQTLKTPGMDTTRFVPPLTPATQRWQRIQQSDAAVLIWDPASGRGVAVRLSF